VDAVKKQKYWNMEFEKHILVRSTSRNTTGKWYIKM
jgi:hypothetical protein